MAKLTGPDGARWSVHRAWFYTSGWTGNEFLAYLLFLPMMAVWPFWLVSHWFGLPWVITVERAGMPRGSVTVHGWSASRRRIREITDKVAAGTWWPT